MEKKTKRVTVTRPSLARILIDAGYEVTRVRSVWDPARFEWELDLDDTSAKLISEYYAQISKVPPAAVRKFLQKKQEGEA